MTPSTGFRNTIATGVAVFAAIVLVDGALHTVAAQNPFGGPRPGAAAAPQVGGIVGWLLARQSREQGSGYGDAYRLIEAFRFREAIPLLERS